MLARGFVVNATAGVETERLVPGGRTYALGVIPGAGSVSFALPIPANVPSGFVFCAQAEVVGSAGLARTNSTPLVVR